jgi:hypothetical protein
MIAAILVAFPRSSTSPLLNSSRKSTSLRKYEPLDEVWGRLPDTKVVRKASEIATGARINHAAERACVFVAYGEWICGICFEMHKCILGAARAACITAISVRLGKS